MNLLHSFSRWRAERGLRWLQDFATIPDGELNVIHLRGASGLVPLGEGEGAILVWVFDVRPGMNPVMMVRLTEAEAEAVYADDPFTTGMLESVRKKLANRWAIIYFRAGKHRSACPFKIPTHGSEQAFVAQLDRAVDSCPPFQWSPTQKPAPTRAIRTAVRARRELAHA